MELYLKFWGGENYFEAGEKFYGRGGDYSENGGNRRRSEIFQTSKKKVVKNLWGNRQKKPGGAANLGSAPGGRHPIYATGS